MSDYFRKIFVVDDTEDNLNAAKEFFSTLSYEVEFASSAKEATDIIRAKGIENKFDVVISDLEMEKPKSGLRVMHEAHVHSTLCFVFTQRDGIGNHADRAILLPAGDGISAWCGETKAVTQAWERALSEVDKYINGKGRAVYESLNRFAKYVGVPFDGNAMILDKLVRGIIDSGY